MAFDLVAGDSLEVLRTLPDNCVDAVVTDPPYGMNSKHPDPVAMLRGWLEEGDHKTSGGGFMGKAWDSDVPGPAIWAECLRVLKPGGHLLAFASSRTVDLMGLSLRIAGFEIRDQIQWLYGCVSDDTEVLTTNGWVPYPELTTRHEVAQWDHETGAISWARPSEVLCYPYDGHLVNLKNRHTDQLVTPNHRVYAKIKKHGRNAPAEVFEVVEAKDLRDHWIVDLPMAGTLEGGRNVDPSFAYLAGWWMTDAWVAKNDPGVCWFSQSKPETLAKLREALAPHAFSEYVKAPKKKQHRPEHSFRVTGEIARRLLAWFPERRLLWEVLGWSLEARRALWQGLMDGDGSDRRAFWSQDPDRRDVFLALSLSLGYRSFMTPGAKKTGVVHVSENTHTTQLQHRHRKAAGPVRYVGNVYSMRIQTGAYVARRNGRPFITGNSGFPKSMNVAIALDKHHKAMGHRGKAIRHGVTDVPGEQKNLTAPKGAPAHEPITEDAKRFNGYGTALKPAHEPIIMARKPIKGTVAKNLIEHGTGAMNVDGCRIASDEKLVRPAIKRTDHDGIALNKGLGAGTQIEPPGRWPANILIDPEAAEALDEQAPKATPSRFFYTAKPSTAEREAGLDAFKQQSAGELTGGRAEGSAGLNNPRAGAGRTSKGRANIHPTVKPIDLMRYLCRLVAPPAAADGSPPVVLDPFVGSGTTGIGAVLEGLSFLGIDLSDEYINIARARIEHYVGGAL